ncbi:MAG: CopG family transcriptional regulator [Candidatus Hydrothermarchaeota archaeon]|nr:CopG family transcriptional regulator [Candidatus Hydrothermarchaeota archaeon]
MSNLSRVTIALNKDTSELLRNALWFYSTYKDLISIHGSKKINTYVEMLSEGEHIILDVDHWLLFLKFIGTSPESEKFWEECRLVAKSHADQLFQKIKSVENLLERLEACNFFKISKSSESEFTLVLGSNISKKFVRTFLEDVLAGLGYKAEVREDFTKLRVRVLK